MPARRSRRISLVSGGWHTASVVVLLGFLQACSSFPSLVRHDDPLSSQQHMQLGAAYEAQGLTRYASEQYEAAFRENKKYTPALIADGNLAFQLGDLKKAEDCFRHVLRIQPNDAGAYNNLATVYITRGEQLEKAQIYINKALQQEGPLRPYILDTQTRLYMQQHRYAEARKSLDDADAAAPKDNKTLLQQLAQTRSKLDAQQPHSLPIKK